MKTVTRILTVVFLAMAFGRVSAQSKNSQELTVPLSDPAKPVTLECSLMHGSIHVEGYDGKEVLVTIYIDSSRDEDEDNNDHGGMKRINLPGGLDVRAEEHDNDVQINAGMERKISALSIKVPQHTARVKVSTISDGEITVSNVSGKVEISDLNGNITAKGISGSVVANGLNGNIVVNMKSVDPATAMAFSTMNGKIDLTLPADTKANLKLKSDNGQMYSDFDIAVDKTTPKVETKNEDHYHEIKIDGWVYGKINGGGPEIMMQSQYGTIYIRKVK